MIQRVLQHFGRLECARELRGVWERKRLEDVTADDVRCAF